MFWNKLEQYHPKKWLPQKCKANECNSVWENQNVSEQTWAISPKEVTATKMQQKWMQFCLAELGLPTATWKTEQNHNERDSEDDLINSRGTQNLKSSRMQTSIWFLICITLLFTSSCVVPSPTIVVESLVTTILAAVPRTSLSAFSRDNPTSSLMTVPVQRMANVNDQQAQMDIRS